MIRIGLLGYTGRMGQLIAHEIGERMDCVLASALVRDKRSIKNPEATFITENPDDVFKASDVVIDFTTPDTMPRFIELAVTHKKAFMSGTTGFGETGAAALQHASGTIPILYGSNTSLSLVAMQKLTSLAAELLAPFDYDIAILEEHHRHKKDAPSGTAKTLGEAVRSGNAGKKIPQFVSIRAGAIVGEHEVIFGGVNETIRIHHSVTDRRVFARGALSAALWVYNRPAGFYTMEDVLDLKRLK